VGDDARSDDRWMVVDGRRWRRTDPARLRRATEALRELERLDDADGP
jgi:hypothetical protein